MALLTISNESALAEAGNYMLMSSVFHRLAVNFSLCAYLLHVSRHYVLTQLLRNLLLARTCRWSIVIVSTEFCGKQSFEIGPGSYHIGQFLQSTWL